jgi:hypothetical protein
MQRTEPPKNEVRPYLIRLVAFILFGIVVMGSVAVWAWFEYGKRLSDAPPLPPGVPPMNTTDR